MSTEHGKTNEANKFVLNLSQRLDLRSSYKHVALQNLSICYPWKNIRRQYKNNELKINAPIWNDEFELPGGFCSLSDIQYYFEYIFKKHDTLKIIAPIYVYINRIYNRLAFKIRDGYKLDLQTLGTMKLFGSTKN